MSQASPYSWPGAYRIDEMMIIDLIQKAFELDDLNWITDVVRVPRYSIPRQVLMSCLMDFLGYSQRVAGEVCMRNHCTAFYSHKMVHETLMYDRQYGIKVRSIYDTLTTLRRGIPCAKEES